MTLRAVLAATAIASAVVLAEQPGRKSGIDLAALDRSVRPQDDLFRFANGRWLATTEVPADRVAYDTFAQLSERVDLSLRAIAEEAVRATAPARSPLRQIGDLYASAMDEARLAGLGATPIRPQLDRVSAIRTRREFAAEAGRLTAMRAGGPFGSSLVVDAEDSTRLLVEIPQGGTLLPNRQYYLKDDAGSIGLRRRYEAYLSRLFTLAEWPDAAAAGRSVLAFETELARLQLPAAASREIARFAPRRTLTELAATMPGFDWAAWGHQIGFDRVSGVVPLQPPFFRGFAALIPKTPLGTLKNWLAARHLHWSAPFLSPEFVDARFQFFGQALNGQGQPRERWRIGISLVSTFLGDALGRLYVERQFSSGARTRAERLMANLLMAFRQSIEEAAWLAPTTRREALKKLSRMRLKIGYPDRWRDVRDLVIRNDDLYGNVIRGLASDNRFWVTHVAGDRDSRIWLVPVQTMNAFYFPAFNELTVPAAMLQPPIFDADVDDAANYGAVGALMGHEISHALDDQGRAYDARGAIRRWWQAPDLEAIRAAALVVVRQYEGYQPIEGVQVSGDLTLAENLADLNGLSVAYRAYTLSLDGKPAPVIDGFTGVQRFFLSWARMWRAKVRQEYLRQWLLTLPYAPNEYRANGPVSHLPAFAEAFAVVPGDRLYRPPDARVKIW